jgi:hypothetical protein
MKTTIAYLCITKAKPEGKTHTYLLALIETEEQGVNDYNIDTISI